MRIHVISFGQLTDITGTELLIQEDIADTHHLVKKLQENFPAFVHSKYVIAVDKKVISTNTLLTDNCTVALLPPFSGG